jgi:cation diffusion facilitator CzcD-associated flavoprotein CzcO
MTTDARRVRVLVIGAGFAGLAMARALDQIGERDFVVLERGSDVGGTWRDNTYPGAACDVPSPLYSYSFAPNPGWTRSYAPQPEIQAYLRGVAERSGVLDRVVLGCLVEEVRWDDQEQLWQVEARGPKGRLRVVADVVVSAAGALSDPRVPDLEGFDRFRGAVFHSARWDHGHDLIDARVAVIGTGASAVQLVPEIAPVAAHVDVYQRTAPWVVPRNDRVYSPVERVALARMPGLQRLYRTAAYWQREALVPAFTRFPQLARPAVRAALRNIAAGISDPELRSRVTPDFELGCKRVLLSDDWYPTLARSDVELVTERIDHLTEDGVVTRDGRHREVDAIIVATGFHVTDPPIARRIVGRAGTTLADHFASHGIQAYKGTTVRGWPNLFLLAGPNTGLGHSSMVLMIEAQVTYVADALRHLRRARAEGPAAVEPRSQAQAAWVGDVQRRMRRTVWERGGCSSWYLDAHGRNVTLWPRATFTFRRLLARFDPAAYDVVARDVVAPDVVAPDVVAPDPEKVHA